MKRCASRPQAKSDRRQELRYYRDLAGPAVALRLNEAIGKALQEISRNPAIGSPRLGQELGVPGLRTWLVSGFPLTLWYVEQADSVDLIRLVGQRQDALKINIEDDED